jgi:hypothetical protein
MRLLVFEDAIVRPAIEASQRLVLKKAESIRIRHVRLYRKQVAATGKKNRHGNRHGEYPSRARP